MMILLGVIAATLALLFVAKLSQDVSWGWASLLLANWYNYTFGISSGTFGSFQLDLIDLVSIALFAAGLVRFIKTIRVGSTSQTLTMIYVVLFLSSFLRGVLDYGLKPAGNEARGLIAGMIGMTYFFTMPASEALIKKFLRFYLYYAGGLFVVGVLAYAGLNVGGPAWAHGNTSTFEDRLLPEPAAGAIGLAFIIAVAWTVYRQGRELRWMRWAAPFFLAMAILLRTRTVWLMLIVVVAATPLIDRKFFGKLVPLLAVGALATLALGVVLYGGKGAVSDQLTDSAQNAGTWEWRVEGWRYLMMDSEPTTLTMLIGKSTGSGFYRFESNTGTYQNYPPHSEYVTEYLRTGVLGFVVVLLLLFRPIFAFAGLQRRNPLAVFPSASTWSLLCLGAVVLGITYSLTPDAWGLVGVANALVIKRKAPLPSGSKASLGLLDAPRLVAGASAMSSAGNAG